MTLEENLGGLPWSTEVEMESEETRRLVQLYVDEKRALMDRFPIGDVVGMADVVWKAYQDGCTIYACGNGGNAAYVGNLITDLANHPFVSDDKSTPMMEGVPRLRAVDLCAPSAAITGIMNDLGPDYIFSQQLINDRVGRGDVVFGFTGSGNSGNILEAFRVAQKEGGVAIAITRGDGGKAREIADHCTIIPGTSRFPGQVGGNDNNFHYEDATSSIAHMITGIMRQRIWEIYGDGTKRDRARS